MMNKWGKEHFPFLFIIDYKADHTLLFPLDEVPENIRFEINHDPPDQKSTLKKSFRFDINPISFEQYKIAFEKVVHELNYGNSYLLNLTFPTRLNTDLDLKTIYELSQAPYRLWIDNEFVVFSPECFVRINDQVISSYPMKGTIDAAIPNAKEKILNDKKETAEHATIVDLIRNDLNRIAEDVRVDNYRYVEEVKTFDKTLLQVSSKIEGDLHPDFYEHLGYIFFSMLPAGSISGAPKKKTLEIIDEAEITSRGFFTGVFGVFDGKNLDSAVMIRYIEQQDSGLVFKSGGGITAKSNTKAEYQELIDKVYVPIV